MLFEALTTAFAKKALELPLAPAVTALQALLQDRKAHSFAKESLRDKYSELILPSSYDWVIDNLEITKVDYIDYFLHNGEPTSKSLAAHLKERLFKRSDAWIHNRPPATLFEVLLDDFLQAYQRYFQTSDPHLTALTLVATTQDILIVTNDIKTFLTRESQNKPLRLPSYASEIRTHLTVVNVPFEIVEEDTTHVDVIITDPSSIFPTQFYVLITKRHFESEDVDALIERSRKKSMGRRLMLASETPLAKATSAYAERRGITVISVPDLRESLLRISSNERFVVGREASDALLRTLNVKETYIEPDAVLCEPGDHLEHKYFATRQPAEQLIADFLADDERRVLFVLGGCGAGKSALAARIVQKFSGDQLWSPILLSFRHFKEPPDIPYITHRAAQVAMSVGGNRQPVVLLDGLDESPQALHIEQKRTNLLGIGQAAARGVKMIVTARSTYFRGMEDFWKLFARSLDHPLWAQMAAFIPEGASRPRVSALVLREFSSDQMRSYLLAFAEWRHKGDGFVDGFLAKVRQNDRIGAYRTLARNPLYLFLLATTQPWERTDVRCLFDVLRLFISYWLERDIEKGKSRWRLSTADRDMFADQVAWWMFSNRKDWISFAEFDAIVRDHFLDRLEPSELASMSLDLQTTGLFSTTGGTISFMTAGFADCYIVSRFMSHSITEQPSLRLPNMSQIELMLGIAESTYSDIDVDVIPLLLESGIEANSSLYAELSIPTDGVLYGAAAGSSWKNINGENDRNRSTGAGLHEIGMPRIRLLFNSSLLLLERAGVPVVVGNLLGLHARASAKLFKRFWGWSGHTPSAKKVHMTRNGRRANMASIMGIMMIVAGVGSTVYISSEDCTRSELEELLRYLNCVPANDGSQRWVANWEFDDGSQMIFHADFLPEHRIWTWN